MQGRMRSVELALALVALLPLAALVAWLFAGGAEDPGDDGGTLLGGRRPHLRDVFEREA